MSIDGREGLCVRRRLCVLTAMLLLWTAAACAFELPSGTSVIESEAFCGVPVTELTLPASVRIIGPRAFSTSTLKHITIPATVTFIDQTAFDGTASDFFATVTAGSYAESWCAARGIRYSYTDVYVVTPAYSAYQFSLQGEKYLGVPYSIMDCQAFVEACLRDIGLRRDLAGSNAWYREMDWVGTPEECRALFGSIPKGAFLFILEFDGNEPPKYKPDGLGNASHMGIYTGIYTGTHKGAMASSKKRGCVIDSYFAGSTINGGWNRVGLWHELDYGAAINEYLATH